MVTFMVKINRGETPTDSRNPPVPPDASRIRSPSGPFGAPSRQAAVGTSPPWAKS